MKTHLVTVLKTYHFVCAATVPVIVILISCGAILVRWGNLERDLYSAPHTRTGAVRARSV